MADTGLNKNEVEDDKHVSLKRGYTSDSQNFDSSDSQNRESSESPPYDGNSLPLCASSWRRDNLEDLKIYIDESTYRSLYPMHIIRDKLLDGKILPADEFVTHFSEVMETSEAYRYLDCPFDELTKGKSIVEQLAIRNDMWDIRLTGSLNNNRKMTEFEASFMTAGKCFTKNLLKCIDRKDKGQTISELMYQQMFASFLLLFNIKCNCSLSKNDTSKRSMKFRDREVSGTPDVLVEMLEFQTSEHAEPVMDWKTLILCEVKKEFKRSRVAPPKQMRFSSTKILSQPSLPDELLGQHGAELLLYHPTSVNNNHIIGMIIEQTHITFTALSITKEQIKNMTDGITKDNVEKGPKLFLTKSYDYLIKSDRKKLTQALLTLGYIQNYGFQKP